MTGELGALDGATWHCEPPDWSLENGVLSLATGAKTDFWRNTFYGFNRDDGHFYGVPTCGDFTAVIAFSGDYEYLYDQAGLMMRIDRDTWIKTGVEFSDGMIHFSVVVTRAGHSDWSVIGAPRASGLQSVRVTRLGDGVIVHRAGLEGTWQLMRLAHFTNDDPVRIGPMACSPQRAGLAVRFTRFEIGAPIDNPLHGD